MFQSLHRHFIRTNHGFLILSSMYVTGVFPIVCAVKASFATGAAVETAFSSLSPPSLVVATRLHLGQASIPPTQESLDTKIQQFHDFCSNSCHSQVGLIAVDVTPKLPGYHLQTAVQAACDKALQQQQRKKQQQSQDKVTTTTHLHIVPVTPWGKCVSALNALVGCARKYSHAIQSHDNDNDSTTTTVIGFDQILFVSAETTTSVEAIDYLKAQMTTDTAVAGAVLNGHDYHPEISCMPLTGLTSPWNTLAIWDLHKLALTGFLLVSDGLLTDHENEPSYGIEEVVAASLLQTILGAENAKCKLVQLPAAVHWQVNDFNDPERSTWQELKMKSKNIRAQRQLALLGGTLEGKLYHC